MRKKKIKLSRFVIVSLLLMGMFSGTVFAGNTHFSVYNLRDYNNSYEYQPISGCDNTKADEAVDWYFKTTYMYFDYYASGCDGMTFKPMVYSSSQGKYVTASTYAGWALYAMTSVDYVSWGVGNGHANVTYRLGVRMDTDYEPWHYGDADGYWNAY